MEINITRFFNDAEPYEFSGSRAERGENAGRETWANALNEGSWTAEEIAAWSDDECNALFIQLVSGDMREAGMDDALPDEFDWEAYEERVEQGSISGDIFRGDDGQVYYSLYR